MAFTKSQEACAISHEGIEYLCGLIRDINGLDTNLIDDLNIKSNGTFSSVRIDSLLNALKTDCNDYAFSLVSNLSRLELKLVTDESSIVDSNILYLYKPTGQTSYNQYVVIEGNKVLLGTTDINMSDYYTITQADIKFTLKTDFDALKTEVDKVKTTLGTKVNRTDIVDNLTSTDTDKPLSANQGKVLKDEVDLKANDDEVVKKTDITTTIDNTVTDEQIASARAILRSKSAIHMDESVNPENYKVGTYFAEGHDSILLSTSDGHPCSEWHIGYVVTGYETSDGTGYKIILAIAMSGNCYIKVQRWNTWTKWINIETTSVADVPLTDISFSSTTNYNIVSDCKYFIKDGICTMMLYVKCNTPKDTWSTVSNVPKPLRLNKYGILGSVAGDGILKYVVNNTGLLQFSKGTSGADYIGTFSYHVAES